MHWEWEWELFGKPPNGLISYAQGGAAASER